MHWIKARPYEKPHTTIYGGEEVEATMQKKIVFVRNLLAATGPRVAKKKRLTRRARRARAMREARSGARAARAGAAAACGKLCTAGKHFA
jgi:hypothetical protein